MSHPDDTERHTFLHLFFERSVKLLCNRAVRKIKEKKKKEAQNKVNLDPEMEAEQTSASNNNN